MKSGIGSASLTFSDGTAVAAAVAVNAYGGVYDHRTGQLAAGPRGDSGAALLDPVDLLLEGRPSIEGQTLANTTIGIVATDATLSREDANYLAQASHDGLAMAIRPCHTMTDGDTMFALATGQNSSNISLSALHAAAVEVTARAVLRAVQTATSLGGIPSLGEIQVV